MFHFRASKPYRFMRYPAVRPFFLVFLFTFLLAFPLKEGLAANGVLRATLENGLRVVIVKNTLAPVVTTQINYLVGADETPAGFPGTAHALEHMMFRGSPGLSADQLARIIADLGGQFNADTQQTVTQYFFTVPSKDLEIPLHVEAIRMRGILATEKLWGLERGAIEQEVAQDLSDPEYVFYTKLISNMFAGTPYAHDALGTRPSFNKTTGAMLRKFHREWYAPNNAIMVIVGDVDPGKTLEKVKRLFGPIPARPVPARPPVRLQPMKPAAIEQQTDLPYEAVVVSYRLPGYDSPDFAAVRVLSDVLDSERGNLFALVAEGKALSADFSRESLPKASIGYAMVSFPVGGNGPEMILTAKGIINDYIKNGVPADLVEASKRHEIAGMEFRKNSVEGLANLWSQALAVEGRRSPDEDIAAIQKVTTADVNRVAREYLVNNRAITAMLTPRPSGKAVTAKRPRGKESFTPTKVKPVKLPSWAKKVESLPSIPPSTVKPVVYTLPNGLRLIVQPETISNTVGVYGRIKNNPALQEPPGQEGAAQIVDGLFPYGSANLGRLAFQKALDDIGAEESAGSSFELEILADHFDEGTKLLADNLLHPVVAETDFRIVRQETAGELKGLMQSPSHLARRALLDALYPKGDPALRQATPQTVQSLKLDNVKAYYGKTFRPDMTTIVVIGNIAPDQAKSVIEKYFGGWKAAGPKPNTDLPPVPPNKPSASVVPDASRVQDEVVLAQTVGVLRSSPFYYPLQVGRHILAGAFYATRLYRDLREETGLVYSVESVLHAGKTRSSFMVIYACDPQNVEKARYIVERDLRQMQNRKVTPLELRQAKVLLLRQIPLSESSTGRIAGKLLDLSIEGLPLNEPILAARHYRETTAGQVKSAFLKWVRPEGFVQIIQGPEPK